MAAGCAPSDEPAAEPSDDPFEQVERAEPEPEERPRAAPRWEQVLEQAGEGSASVEFPIFEDALQWRAQWSCEQGSLRLQLTGSDEPIVEADCPDEGEAFAIETGLVGLEVEASGPWTLAVEQQVDTAFSEPPLDGMEEGQVLASGEFFGVERTGAGTATLYRLPDDRLALRFTELQTVASPDLFVWVSEAAEPTTSAAIFDTPHVNLGQVVTTLGDSNYVLPDGVLPEQVRAVVIWCDPLRIAYAAAALSPAP